MTVISEAYLRNRVLPDGAKVEARETDTVLQSARDYAKRHGITIVRTKGGEYSMPSDTSRFGTGFADAVSGARRVRKPENMTHLKSNLLVRKDHPRIVFRGKLDSLEAKIVSVQLTADEEGKPETLGRLGEILDFVRLVLAAEVKDEPLAADGIFGMSWDEVRERSHDHGKYYGTGHVLPGFERGRLFCGLNELRCAFREAEIQAVRAFGDGRPDIVLAMNRLSSAVYVLELGEAGK